MKKSNKQQNKFFRPFRKKYNNHPKNDEQIRKSQKYELTLFTQFLNKNNRKKYHFTLFTTLFQTVNIMNITKMKAISKNNFAKCGGKRQWT